MTSFKPRALTRSAVLSACVAVAPMAARSAMQVIDAPQFQIRYDDARTGLYGAPIVANGSLLWFPGGSPGFEASTTRGIDVASASFSLQVQMKPGFVLEGVRMEVEGDWLAFGRAAVAALGLLRVAPAPGPVQRDTELFLLETRPPAAQSLDLTAWQGAIDVAPGRGTSFANVTFQNVLFAHALPRDDGPIASPGLFDLYGLLDRADADGGATAPAPWMQPDSGWSRASNSFALVDLKQVTLHFAVSAIPEPASLALLLAGLAVVAGAARTRRREQRFDALPTARASAVGG